MKNSRRTLSTLLLALCCAAPGLSAQALDTNEILVRTGRQISAYLDQLSDVKCTETVKQEKLQPNGHREREQTATYDYLVLMQGNHDEFLLNESRLLQSEHTEKKEALPMLLTNGFSNLFLVFHPYYRDDFKFEVLGQEELNGHTVIRVAFTHIPGTRTPAAIAVRGREYPLELTGTAWIDARDAMVTRMEAELANNMQDVGLRKLRVETTYEPISLPGWDHRRSFPVQAQVEVETLRQHWRNVHTFSNYKRFTVDSESTVLASKEN